jgi:hypothetical protein
MNETHDPETNQATTLSADKTNGNHPMLTMPYELHKTQEQLHCCETTSSTFLSNSTDTEISSSAPSSSSTNPNAPHSNANSVDPNTTTAVHNNNYFFLSALQENDTHHNDSSNSLSDYPTDEQTLNTLNSLNSHYRKMFGMEEEEECGDTNTPCYGRSLTGGSAASTLEDCVAIDDLNDSADGIGTSFAAAAAAAAAAAITVGSKQVNTDNDQGGGLNQSVHSSNDSMENNVQQKKNKDRPNRFLILEMAKKRMGMARSGVRKSSPSCDAAAASDENEDDAFNADNKHKASNNTPAVMNNMAQAIQDDKSNGETTDSDTFLGDAIVENVAPTSTTSLEPNPISNHSDESLPSYNIHASNLSQSTMTHSTTRGLQNAFVNVGGDTTVYYSSHRDLHKSSEEGSFLQGATVENVVTSTTIPANNSSCSQSRHKTNSDESLPSYNIHASTLSQSTKTTSTNRLPNAFVNVGGDAYIYSSPKQQSFEPPINASFETAASPSTVVASGNSSKPRSKESVSASSGTAMSGNGTSESGTTSSGTSGESIPSTSAKDLYKSTILLVAAGRPLDSRIPSAASTVVDDMILHESNLAVQNLGRDASPHRDVIQAAAITPVRRNATDSLPSYSYNQAFENSDVVTSNPECSLPTISSTKENPFAPNLPEDYSFCPSSKHSTYSTLTDEYRSYYDVSRRTGTAITKELEGRDPDGGGIQKTPSGPVDVDTANIISADDEESFQYDSSSVARPPASPRPNPQSWVFSYGNSDHLSSIIQYPSADAGDISGREAEGYVDEESAMRYASLHRSRRGCMPKLLIWAAVVLLAVSLATVAFGVLWQHDDDVQTNTLLGRPVSTSKDEESGPSEQRPGLIPAGPELISKEPSSLPTSSPVLAKPSAPIASIATELSTKEPSIGSSQSPSSTPKLPIEEVLESDAPSSKPTPRPSLEEPTLHPATKSPVTARPSKQPTNPTVSVQAIDESKTYTAKIKVSRDTYIKSTASMWNYGNSDFLRVDRDPRSITVLAFEINLGNDLIESSKRHYDASEENQSNRRDQTTQLKVKVKEAKLRLYSLEDSEAGGEVYGLTDAKTWNESELTWDNARSEVSASGEVFVSVIDGYIDEGLWYEVDVTGAFDCCVKTVGTMNVNLLIRTESSDGVTYASKEYASGSYAPELIVTYSVLN